MNIEIQVRELANIFGESRIRDSLKKLAEIEAGLCLKKIGQIKNELNSFEKQFNMKSEKAWTKFQSGKLGDTPDIMEWMGLYENLSDFQEYYHRIQSSKILC